jgi:SpoVK/Ycf46/Vps4 family AAA+-type ATPase
MENKTKKMTSTDVIVRMVNAINNDNDSDFYKAVHEFANTLAYGGDNRHRIQSAIKLKPMRLRKLDDLPSNIKNLLIQGGNEEENVFLTETIRAFIETLLIEWQHTEVYRMHNISPRNKILLHGPTGNGKTTIARYIARRSGLAFVEINSDLVIDSHLGVTSGNIYNIISSINEPSVLFWDEVDSIGAKRGGDNRAAGMENDRMVNSILVNLQKLDDNVIFIGATNRMDALDAAFLRRFDVKLEVPAPTKQELQRYFLQLMDHYNLREQILGMGLEGINSYSDAKLRATESARQFLLKSFSK